MNTSSLIRLFLMAAIGGGSFLLMRLGAPVVGPVLLAEYRISLAAVFLLVVSLLLRRKLDVRKHWKHFLVLGLFSFALPSLLFAFAAQTLPVSMMAILNATSPTFGAVAAAVQARQLPAPKRMFGLMLGIAGVGLLVGFDQAALRSGAGLAVLAVLAAAFSYGVATVKATSARQVDPLSNTHGSMWAAFLLLAPLGLAAPAHAPLALNMMLVVLALGILCSGVAFLLYFKLVADLGATSALTVTFLVPMFGIFWGYLFLGEAIGWQTVLGSVVVISGTALVTGRGIECTQRIQGQAVAVHGSGKTVRNF